MWRRDLGCAGVRSPHIRWLPTPMFCAGTSTIAKVPVVPTVQPQVLSSIVVFPGTNAVVNSDRGTAQMGQLSWIRQYISSNLDEIFFSNSLIRFAFSSLHLQHFFIPIHISHSQTRRRPQESRSKARRPPPSAPPPPAYTSESHSKARRPPPSAPPSPIRRPQCHTHSHALLLLQSRGFPPLLHISIKSIHVNMHLLRLCRYISLTPP
jgi:hypothetical protein